MKIFVIGNIGSGKSTVAKILSNKLHAKLIDLDKIGHDVLIQNKDKVEECFGEFQTRKELAKLAGGRIEELSRLLHPDIYKNMLKELSEENVVVEESVYDEQFLNHADKIVCVKTDFDIRRERAVNPYFEKLNAQQQQDLEKHADYVIHNNGTLEDLQEKCEEAINELF